MGRVFRAQHLRMKRDVAIKFLSPELLDNKSARQRFQREVEAAARLHHSHIVSAFDADEVEGHFFQVTEFIKRRLLRLRRV